MCKISKIIYGDIDYVVNPKPFKLVNWMQVPVSLPYFYKNMSTILLLVGAIGMSIGAIIILYGWIDHNGWLKTGCDVCFNAFILIALSFILFILGL